jgi:hypothetical protein
MAKMHVLYIHCRGTFHLSAIYTLFVIDKTKSTCLADGSGCGHAEKRPACIVPCIC